MVFKIPLPPLTPLRSSLNRLLTHSPFAFHNHHAKANPLKTLINNKSAIPELISRFLDQGTPELALKTFRISGIRDLSLQNLLARRLCDFGLYDDVLNVYRVCRLAGCSSDNYTFPFVLKACAVRSEVGLGREVHCSVLRSGYGGNVVVQTALVDFYCRIERIDVARFVLDGMPEPDLVSWNAFVAGCSWNGVDREAVDAVKEIWVKGLRPNVSTLVSVIPVCARLGYLDVGKSLHVYAIKSGFESDESLPPALISMYASNGDVVPSRTLFDLSPTKNVVTWNSIIHAYVQNLQYIEAYELFRLMLLADYRPNRVTFLSVIPCCENLSSLSLGQCGHAYAIKGGVESQAGVATMLISMYTKFGNIDSAKLIFDSVPHKDLLTWNSMLSAYAHNGDWDRTFASVRELQSSGHVLDSISLISVLSSCCEVEALLHGKSVHAYSIRKGLDLHLNLVNLLLSFYSRCHQLGYSFKLFQTMGDRDSVSWNTMISGCVQDGENEKAISLIQQMQREGVELDLVSLISILPSFNTRDGHGIAQGMAVHGYAVKAGFASDIPLANALINMYCSGDDLNAAEMLFNTMPLRCNVSWNTLMTGYLSHGLHDKLITLFREMLNHGHKPDQVTLLNIVPACSNLLQGLSIHAHAVRIGAIVETPVLSSMVFMYSRFGKTASCFSLFQSGEKHDISIWNSRISILVSAGDVQNASGFFRRLLWNDMRPDHFTILGLISACLQLNTVDFCHPILAFVIKGGFREDPTISNALINLYAKCGDVAIARKLFDKTLNKDAVTWSIMINGYGSHGEGEAAVALLLNMVNSGFWPDNAAYLSVLSACSHSGLVEQTSEVLRSMLVNGIQPTTEHYACVLDHLGRAGDLSEAYDMMRRFGESASSSMLDSLLGACRYHGNIELGIKIGELMIEKGTDHDAGSYVMLHNMYVAAGRYGDAERLRALGLDKRRLKKVPGFSLLGSST